MSKRVAFYLRVSTGEQTTENQRREREHVAKRSGWDVVEICVTSAPVGQIEVFA